MMVSNSSDTFMTNDKKWPSTCLPCLFRSTRFQNWEVNNEQHAEWKFVSPLKAENTYKGQNLPYGASQML